MEHLHNSLSDTLTPQSGVMTPTAFIPKRPLTSVCSGLTRVLCCGGLIAGCTSVKCVWKRPQRCLSRAQLRLSGRLNKGQTPTACCYKMLHSKPRKYHVTVRLLTHRRKGQHIIVHNNCLSITVSSYHTGPVKANEM